MTPQQAKKFLKDNDIRFILAQFVDIHGSAKAKAVPVEHLVGWQGNLTPRVVSLLVGPGGEVIQTAVELSGEGFALISLPVR